MAQDSPPRTRALSLRDPIVDAPPGPGSVPRAPATVRTIEPTDRDRSPIAGERRGQLRQLDAHGVDEPGQIIHVVTVGDRPEPQC